MRARACSSARGNSIRLSRAWRVHGRRESNVQPHLRGGCQQPRIVHGILLVEVQMHRHSLFGRHQMVLLGGPGSYHGQAVGAHHGSRGGPDCRITCRRWHVLYTTGAGSPAIQRYCLCPHGCAPTRRMPIGRYPGGNPPCRVKPWFSAVALHLSSTIDVGPSPDPSAHFGSSTRSV